MRKILLTGGCSYTDKDWCSDFHDIGPNAWPFWPEILGKKLDMEVINLAHSGAGNEYIYYSLLDKIATIDNIGLVIPAWSVCQRRDWKIKGKWFNNTQVCNTGKLAVGFFGYGSNDMFGFLDKSIGYYYSLQEICKSKKIPIKQVHMLHIFHGWWYNPVTQKQDAVEMDNSRFLQHINNNIYCDKIDKNFIGWPGDPGIGGFSIKSDVLGYGKYEVSEKDTHPTAKGQEKIAEFIYDRLG